MDTWLSATMLAAPRLIRFNESPTAEFLVAVGQPGAAFSAERN